MTPGLVVSVPHPWHPQEDSCRQPLSPALPPATQLARGCAATVDGLETSPQGRLTFFCILQTHNSTCCRTTNCSLFMKEFALCSGLFQLQRAQEKAALVAGQ